MENIIPGFHKHHLEEEYRTLPPRPPYGPGYGGGAYEYTGQPVGFEHLGSPPKHKLSELDAKTIAQLGYEGPEGERRKVEAIKEQIYERDYERATGYSHPPRPEGYVYTDEYSHHDKHKHKYGHSSHAHSSHSHGRRDSDSDDDYAGQDERYRRTSRHAGEDRYGHGRGVYVVTPPPVHVERKYEEDGTVVERIFPESSSGNTYAVPDHGKIHYGRQDSFPETALQEAANAYAHGRREYPSGYSRERPPPSGYAPPYSDATGSYVRRPYDAPSEYVDERYRRY